MMQPATLLLLALVLPLAAAAPPAWRVQRHTDCGSKATVLWKLSFEACVQKASAAKGGFMFTNERWPASGTGCAVGLPPCTKPATTGAYGNWDSYYCPAPDGQCAAPVAPPAGRPGPPPAPAPHGAEPCSAPGALSTTAPNILTIGDSISMCGYGYGHFVNDMLVGQTNGTLAGYSSACGQMVRPPAPPVCW